MINRLLTLGQGNPGALSVLKQLVDGGHEETIDQLENAGATGARIWLLYKDICEEDLDRLVLASVNIPTLFIEYPAVKAEWDYYAQLPL